MPKYFSLKNTSDPNLWFFESVATALAEFFICFIFIFVFFWNCTRFYLKIVDLTNFIFNSFFWYFLVFFFFRKFITICVIIFNFFWVFRWYSFGICIFFYFLWSIFLILSSILFRSSCVWSWKSFADFLKWKN